MTRGTLRHGVSCAVVGASLGLIGSATAGPIISFGFNDLSTNYSTDTQTLTAFAVDLDLLKTAGDVSRLVAPGGTALYPPGFVSLGTQADVNLTMDIFNIGATTANGAGTLLITDADGDTISADIAGDWQLVGGMFYVFVGTLQNVFIASDDGFFDGPGDGSGSFPLGFDAEPPYTGAALYLYFGGFGSFFTQDIQGAPGQIVGEIVPAPGAAALAGLAGLLAIGRRRR